MKVPSISIITVTFNAGSFLERTLKSIDNQSSKDFELLLVDGASKDNTLEIAQAFSSIVTKIVSEKDQGLYDAMNKGIRLAKGEYLWFINAGDEIASSEILKDILFTIKNTKADIVYGDAMVVDNAGNSLGLRSSRTPHKLKNNIDWRDFRYGMLICHQSFLVKKAIAPFYKIKNLSADIDFEIRALKKAESTAFIPKPLILYLQGGLSTQRLKTSLQHRFLILQDHFGFLPNIWNHLYILFRGVFRLIRMGKYW